MNRKKSRLPLCVLVLLALTAVALGVLVTAEAQERAAGSASALDRIIDRIEARYAGEGFAADFLQESTLKAMDITDIASGRIFIKRPGKMRWEYETPEKQTIITDSRRLWIFRPEDNQVMVGEAPAYFKDGQGAGFLSDVKQIRKNFSIAMAAGETQSALVLRLVPVRPMADLSDIYLTLSKEDFNIIRIETYNPYGDRTRIRLSRIDFRQILSDDMFGFVIPEGADVLQLDP